MTLMNTAFVTLTAVLFALCLRGQQKDIAALLGMAAVIVLFAVTGERIRDAVTVLARMADNSAWSDIAKVMFKAFGITALVRITSDICTQAGEATIAGQVEMLGAVEITLLALPLASRLLEIAESLLS